MIKCNNKECRYWVNKLCIHQGLEHNEIGVCISMRYKNG